MKRWLKIDWWDDCDIIKIGNVKKMISFFIKKIFLKKAIGDQGSYLLLNAYIDNSRDNLVISVKLKNKKAELEKTLLSDDISIDDVTSTELEKSMTVCLNSVKKLLDRRSRHVEKFENQISFIFKYEKNLTTEINKIKEKCVNLINRHYKEDDTEHEILVFDQSSKLW